MNKVVNQIKKKQHPKYKVNKANKDIVELTHTQKCNEEVRRRTMQLINFRQEQA